MTRPWALPFRRAAVVAALASAGVLTAVPSADAANDWVPVATISATISNTAGRVCIGGGGTDLGCPTYAPSLTTAGDVSVSGNLSAARFIGDGSGLTGLNASNVSITTGASGSLVFRDGYGSLMASSGFSISSTTGSVGIGAGAPSWLGTNGLYAVGGIATSSSLYLSSGQFVYWGNASTKINGVAGSANDFMAFATSGTEQMRIVSTGYVGIGTPNPSSTLHIVGATGGISGGLVIGAATGSAMRAALFPVGNNSTAMQIFNNTGGFYIKNKSGNNFALFDNDAGALMIGSGVNGNPSATLFVRGSALTTSWTGINFSNALNVTPTAPLEVSGTISATALLINGQSVTGGVSTFASLTDVSYSAAAGNVFGPGSLTGAAGTATTTTAFGINALAASNLTGAANSAFGSNALRNASTGNYNSAFGAGALNAVTSGSNNNAYGVNALKNLSSGNYNIGIGNNALVSATTGSSNIAVGIQSLYTLTTGTNNAAIGFSTGFYGTSGSYNSLFGSFSGQNITTGGSNLLLGYNAGGSITSGSSNTVIGTNISPYSNTGSNQLAIANAIWGDVGLGSTLQAKVGINVTSPTTSLEVSGTVSATAFAATGTSLAQINVRTPGSLNVGLLGVDSNAFWQVSGTGGSLRGSSGAAITWGYGRAFIGSNYNSISATLHVGGNALITSWTGINFSSNNVTPTTPLEVSGTVSATAFVGDGSGLTGIAANVSVTTGASGSLVFRDAYGGLMASSMLNVSSTTGSVGIGAGAPASVGSYGLYVSNSIYAGLNIGVINGAVLGVSNGVALVRPYGSTATDLSFSPGSNQPEAMRIVSGGYVGIGTPNPSSNLHVSGTIRADNSFIVTGAGNLTGSNGNLNVTSPRDLLLSPSSTEVMRIVSTGYVGMGTSSPYANLHIVRSGTVISPTSGLGQSLIMQNTGGASAGTGISILSGNAGLGRVYFGDTDNDNIGSISYYHSDDSMRFAVSATEAVRIVSTGYVGIGTTSPNAFLHVKGAGTTPSLLLERSAVGSAVFQLGGAPSALSMGWANAAGGFIGGLTIASNSYALGVNLSSPYAPSQTLHVNGSALTTSWTGINFSSSSKVTPTAPLEVSGTISATALLINGQSVTGGVSTFASLTDVSYSSVGYNVFGPGSLTGANAGVTETTAFGYNALKSNSNIGYANSAFGASALQNNTTGVFNTAVGRTALRGTSSGNYNTAVGVGSLISNTTGSSNAAFGINTLNNNPTGNSNAAFGAFAGQLLASGNSNLLLGFNAGGGMTSGGSNTVIGASVSPYSNTGNNQLAIANAIWGDVGLGSTLQAKVGINVTSPTTNFDVSGTSYFNGSVGIGTSTPSSSLHVMGSIYAHNMWLRRPADGVYIQSVGTSSTNSQTLFIRGMNTAIAPAAPAIALMNTNSNALLTLFSSTTNPALAFVGIGISDTQPSATLHVSGSLWAGTISATRFVGDGSGLTGITAAANDNLVSGSAYVRALQNQGAIVSGSLAVSGTLKLAESPPDICGAGAYGSLKVVNGRPYFCRR